LDFASGGLLLAREEGRRAPWVVPSALRQRLRGKFSIGNEVNLGPKQLAGPLLGGRRTGRCERRCGSGWSESAWLVGERRHGNLLFSMRPIKTSKTFNHLNLGRGLGKYQKRPKRPELQGFLQPLL
jgi:hypothetical protein